MGLAEENPDKMIGYLQASNRNLQTNKVYLQLSETDDNDSFN